MIYFNNMENKTLFKFEELPHIPIKNQMVMFKHKEYFVVNVIHNLGFAIDYNGMPTGEGFQNIYVYLDTQARPYSGLR